MQAGWLGLAEAPEQTGIDIPARDGDTLRLGEADFHVLLTPTQILNPTFATACITVALGQFQQTLYNQRMCAFGSQHPNGANFAMGDGSTRFISQSLSQEALTFLCIRNDGATVIPD